MLGPEALYWAGRWAEGATTLEQAAERVTRGVYSLGPSVMQYDCRHGDSHYSKTGFDCTAFLELLSGTPDSNGRLVNCSDCATFVSTFANLLGCNLSQSQIGYTFDVNPVILIGRQGLKLPCGLRGWLYHEVAWTGGCGPDDRVFDSCLQLNADINLPGSPPQPIQPLNLRFGNPGDGDYVDLLAPDTPKGRPDCQPQPDTRRHRKFMHPQSLNQMVTADRLLTHLKNLHLYDEWQNSNTLDTNLFVWQFLASDVQIPGLKSRKIQRIEVRDTVRAVHSIWAPTGGEKHVLFNVEIYECSSRREAQHLLLERIAQMQFADTLTRREQSEIGDVAFVTPADDMILFARANLALLISHIGHEEAPVSKIASGFDAQFVSRPSAPAKEVAAPEIQTVELAAPFRLEAALLSTAIPNPQNENLWFKFFSEAGEIQMVDGIPHYKPEREGMHEITIFAINSAGNAATTSLQFFI